MSEVRVSDASSLICSSEKGRLRRSSGGAHARLRPVWFGAVRDGAHATPGAGDDVASRRLDAVVDGSPEFRLRANHPKPSGRHGEAVDDYFFLAAILMGLFTLMEW